MTTNRSETSAQSRGWLKAPMLAPTGASRRRREIPGRRSAAVAGALILSAVLSLFFAACTGEPKRIVMDDFEFGALTDWKAASSGSGG